MKSFIVFFYSIILFSLVSTLAFCEKPNFILIIGDDIDEGFNDPTPVEPVGINGGRTLGAQRINAFSFALSIWAQELNSNTPIIVLAYFDPLPCDLETGNVNLGRAGATTIWSDFSNAPFPETWYSSALSDHLSGADVNPGAPDIIATFNSTLDEDCIPGWGWYYGLDENPAPNRIDIIPTLLHELSHGLGFQNYVNESNGEFINSIPDIYSRYTLDVTRGLHWHEMETSGDRVNSATNTRDLVWDGPVVNSVLPSMMEDYAQPFVYFETATITGEPLYAAGADFGPPLDATGVVGKLSWGADSSGNTEACFPFKSFPSGCIALIDRGTCLFTDKVQHAQDAGAIGVIIVDRNEGKIPVRLGGQSDTITIPSVRIMAQDGDVLKELIKKGEDVIVTLKTEQLKSGVHKNGKALLYAPNPVELGSSVSHWDVSAYPDLLMEPLLRKTTYDVDVTTNLLHDIGWNTILSTPTPTPSYTPTHTPTPSNTFTPTPTLTPSNTPAKTPIPSNTPVPTYTPTKTTTPTNTPSPTPTPTATMTPSPSNTPAATPSPSVVPGYDIVGVGYTIFQIVQVNKNSSGTLDEGDLVFSFGTRNSDYFTGDWNGDGKSGVGAVEPSGLVTIDRNEDNRFDPQTDVEFSLPPGAWLVTGDWNGDGRETVGYFQDGVLTLANSLSPNADSTVPLTSSAGIVQIFAGDWDGNGADSIGYRTTANEIVLDRNDNFILGDAGDEQFTLSVSGGRLVAGDWSGYGIETIGWFENGQWWLYTNADYILDESDRTFFFGYANGQPLAFRLAEELEDIQIPEITPVSSNNTVYVTDDTASFADLSGGEDLDSPADSELVIRWNLARAGVSLFNVKEVHVYMKSGLADAFTYLGRTADSTQSFLRWRSGEPLLNPVYWEGPQFGGQYQFRIYVLSKTGIPRFFGPYENSGPVGFIQN